MKYLIGKAPDQRKPCHLNYFRSILSGIIIENYTAKRNPESQAQRYPPNYQIIHGILDF